jgi:hypothetical protein
LTGGRQRLLLLLRCCCYAAAAATLLLLPLEPAVGEMRSWHCSSTCRKGVVAFQIATFSLTHNKIMSKKEKLKI